MLSQLAHAVQGSSLILRVQCFVTCLCDPRGLPTIPNSSVSLDKPSLATILAPLISPTDEEKQMFRLGCGGVGVAASGPERLTSEAQNAVARIGPKRARDVGGVEIHTEMYCI
jgi:ferric-chelate reductase